MSKERPGWTKLKEDEDGMGQLVKGGFEARSTKFGFDSTELFDRALGANKAESCNLQKLSPFGKGQVSSPHWLQWQVPWYNAQPIQLCVTTLTG